MYYASEQEQEASLAFLACMLLHANSSADIGT